MRASTLRRLFVSLAVAACGAACQKEPPLVPPPPPEVERPAVFLEPVPAMPEGHPDLEGLRIPARSPRRLSVDQLERSLDVIGNLPLGTVKLPADLAVTLGRPDFNRVNEEQLEPSPLFMKFMIDLGGFVCGSLADYEPARPLEERVFTRHGVNVDENLRFLLLRFTGLEGEDAAPYLPRLRAAFDRGDQASTRAMGGYEAACMALLASPEFLLY